MVRKKKRRGLLLSYIGQSVDATLRIRIEPFLIHWSSVSVRRLNDF